MSYGNFRFNGVLVQDRCAYACNNAFIALLTVIELRILGIGLKTNKNATSPYESDHERFIFVGVIQLFLVPGRDWGREAVTLLYYTSCVYSDVSNFFPPFNPLQYVSHYILVKRTHAPTGYGPVFPFRPPWREHVSAVPSFSSFTPPPAAPEGSFFPRPFVHTFPLKIVLWIDFELAFY